MNVFRLAEIVCQPLSEFGLQFNVQVGDNLRNVWIGHKNPVKRFDVEPCDQSSLINWNGKLPEFDNKYKRFDAAEIVNAVIHAFRKARIVDYIFKESYLLMKWENGSFEDVLISDLNSSLHRVTTFSGRKRKTDAASAVPCKKMCLSENRASKKFDKKDYRWPRRRNTLQTPSKISNKTTETISLDTILYDCKQHGKFTISDNLLLRISSLSKNDTSLKVVIDKFFEQERRFSKNNGYYRMFQKHVRQSAGDDQLKPVLKKQVISFTCDILRHLLPASFFGNSNRIRKRFYSVIAQFINSAKHQAFSLQWFIECFEPLPPWLLEIHQPTAIKFVKVVNEFMESILKSFFYITECGSSGYELFYYSKSHIESITARKINELVATGVLKRVNEDDNLERRWLENRLAAEIEVTATSELDNLMPEATEYQPSAAKVRFLPKSRDSHECRMITIAKKPPLGERKWKLFAKRYSDRRDVMGIVKRFLDFLIGSVGTGIQPLYTNPQLKKAWEKIKTMKAAGKKLYFVKTDISDAFGSVEHSRLFKLLERWCSKFKNLKELMISEWLIRRGKLRKVSRYSFSRKLFANRVLHSVQYSDRKDISPIFIINVIKQIVSLQSLRIGRFLYRVQVGLCQGGAGGLSPRLCDLYYSGLDGGLRSLTSDDQSFLLRAMDDYLYVTSVKSKAMDFHNLVIEGIPLYNTCFNGKKLVTNLFKEVRVFPYLGLIFDIELLTVEPNFSRYLATSVLYFVKLSYWAKDPRLQKDKFFIDRSLNLNTLKLVSIVYENKESDCQFLKKVFVLSCAVQVDRILALALYLKSSVDSLKYVFVKISKKLARVVNKLCPKIAPSFILYSFYQICFHFFHKYDSRFENVTKIIKMQIIRLFDELDESHDVIANLLANANLKYWRPLKNKVT